MGRLKGGMGSHQSAAIKEETWLTPPYILDRIGMFDLDPCAALDQPWRTAATQYTVEDNGLAQAWHGRVWLNPPYGRQTGQWLSRLADHGNGIALIFARTETAMFFEHVWRKASALLFLEGRIHFHHADGTRAKANAGAPSVLVAYGKENAEVLRSNPVPGEYVHLESRAMTHPTHQEDGYGNQTAER